MIILPDLISDAPSAIRSFLIQRIPIIEISSITLPNFGNIVRQVHKISNFDLNAIHRAASTADKLNNAFKFTNFDKVFGRGFVQELQQSPFNNKFAYRYTIDAIQLSTGDQRTLGYRHDSDFLLTKDEFNAIVSEQINRLRQAPDDSDLTPIENTTALTGIFTK